MLVLVTGGAGLLGRALVPRATAAGWTVVAPSSAELDVRDRAGVLALVTALRPAAIAHLAYRRDERDTIVDGSAVMAEAATSVGARLVHLSSDVVFAGRPAPYEESAPTDPVNDYGRAKADAEVAVADRDPAAVLVRTSLLYAADAQATCQIDVARVLAGESAMRFFTDEVRSFTLVDDLADVVTGLLDRRDVRGPLHVAGPEPLDRASFARLVAARLGADPDAVPTSTLAESGLDRSGHVVLDVSLAESLGCGCRPVSDVLG